MATLKLQLTTQENADNITAKETNVHYCSHTLYFSKMPRKGSAQITIYRQTKIENSIGYQWECQEASGQIELTSPILEYPMQSNFIVGEKYKVIATINHEEKHIFNFALQPVASSVESRTFLTVTPNHAEGYTQLRTALAAGQDTGERELKIYRAKYSLVPEWQEIHHITHIPYTKDFGYCYDWKDITTPFGEFVLYKAEWQNEDSLFSNPIILDTDDMYLSFGAGLLKVRYNPKLTGYSQQVKDTVVTTLGSKYPFVIRNGAQNYTQFQIGGLISACADEAHIFFSDAQAFGESASLMQNHELYDFIYEREFKNKIINLLYSGQPCLFRSLPEGNKLVRLTEISLTSEEKLGRMIYSFQAKASEIGDALSADELKKFKILSTTEELDWVVPTATIIQPDNGIYVYEAVIDEIKNAIILV